MLLLADAVMLDVVLLLLDVALILVVVELISSVWEVFTVVDEVELDVFCAEVEVVTCVLDAEEDNDVERETAGVLLMVLLVSVTLVAARVVLLEVDDATV